MFTAAAEVVRSISDDGAPPRPAAIPPWDPASLPPAEAGTAPELEAALRKLVSDALATKAARTALFLPPTDSSRPGASPAAAAVAALPDGWSPARPDVIAAASGALRADGGLQALRSGLVPRRLSDDAFWRIYFGHVERVRAELRAAKGAGGGAPGAVPAGAAVGGKKPAGAAAAAAAAARPRVDAHVGQTLFGEEEDEEEEEETSASTAAPLSAPTGRGDTGAAAESTPATKGPVETAPVAAVTATKAAPAGAATPTRAAAAAAAAPAPSARPAVAARPVGKKDAWEDELDDIFGEE